MNLVPFYRRPFFRTLLGMLFWLLLYGIIQSMNAKATWRVYVLDLAFALSAFLMLAGIAASLLLPVETPRERLHAMRHMLSYFLGRRGPSLIIRNGKTIQPEPNQAAPGPGVAMVDPSSAILVRTQTGFLPPLGPGTHFTHEKEHLALCLDLRPQIRFLRGATPEARQGQEQRATAITRDGIPISADMHIVFSLDPGHNRPLRLGLDPGKPPYEFNPQAAQEAMLAQAHDRDQQDCWTDLPLHVLTDVWRSIVKDMRLEHFFPSEQDHQPLLEKLRHALLNQLANPGDEAGMEPNAYRRLQASGIRVLDVGVETLYLPKDVQQDRNRWLYQRQQHASQAEMQASQEAQTLAQTQGRRQGSQRILESSTASLRAMLSAGSKLDLPSSIRMTLEDAAVLAAREGLMHAGTSLANHLQQLAANFAKGAQDSDKGESA